MDMEHNRSIEDVITLAENAKLIPSTLLPVTQSVYFGQHFGEEGEDVKLLEVEPQLLATLEHGERFVLRGEENDNSVICSKNKTFEMRVAETSNSILLVNGLKLPSEIPKNSPLSVTPKYVTGVHHKYLELKVCKPKLHRLKVLLEENAYNGNSLEDSEKRKYTFDDILDKVQGSEEEIMTELKNLKAYKIDGHWRLLDFDYHFRILSHILNLVESNSWSLDKVPRQETIRTLAEIETAEVFGQCFQHFFEKLETMNADDDDLYRITDIDVSCFCAEMLLRASGKFNLEEFLVIWQQSVPEGITTNLSQLEGVALVDDSSPASIKYFPTCALPEEPVHRFSALFDERPKWAMNEIRPYLTDITTDQSGISTLLAKFTRASSHDGIKYYSSKHAR